MSSVEEKSKQQENNPNAEQLTRLQQESDYFKNQYLSCYEAYQDVLNSTSWRITAPLRKGISFLYQFRTHTGSFQQKLKLMVSRLLRLTPTSLKVKIKNYLSKTSAASNTSAKQSANSDTPFALDKLVHRGNAGNPLFQQLFAQACGEKQDYVELSSKQLASDNSLLKYIAFYLPQFHPIPENDQWWGRGFTEWTNVSKAVPQFDGHYQPHLPGELGFYDLRLYEVLQRQVELAKQYGLHGFCFHHYWFAGKRLLETPFQHVMEHPELELNFCLCWANENWTRRWDGLENDILIGQQHSEQDDLAFIADIAPALKDKRYIRINNKPVLILYRPALLPDTKATAERWRNYCRENDIGELYLVIAQVFGESDPRPFGFDAAVEFPPHGVGHKLRKITPDVALHHKEYTGTVYDYQELAEITEENVSSPFPLFRTVFPSWDNEARKPGRGDTFANSTPSAYAKWLEKVSRYALKNPIEDASLVFINAWNEWGEGAHLEPDRKYGYAYLETTAKVLNAFSPEIQNKLASTRENLQKQHNIAVVLHLYYIELWEEIHLYLNNITQGFDLYISVPQGIHLDDIEAILTAFPKAHLFDFENRGRDMGPFIEIFREIAPLKYDYLCKLHSKKSLYFDDGGNWRNDLFSKLLGNIQDTASEKDKNNTVNNILNSFDNHSDIGIVAPKGYLLNLSDYIGSNKDDLKLMTKKLQIKLSLDKPFVAGSMFWCRPAVLEPVLELAMALEQFPVERNQRDGTPAHALERLFSLLVDEKGMRIVETGE